MLRALLCCALAIGVAAPATASSGAPYAGQETRDIKALSAQETADLLAGRGLGLALAAELNGYPGPAHVLELASELALSVEQRAKTEALFTSMQSRAAALGAQLVAEERALDRMFASRSITPAGLGDALERIATLQAAVRRVHLVAHLEQTALLTPTQITRYNALRGYGGGHGTHGSPAHRRH